MLRNFSFVLRKKLAGCAMPGYWGPLEDDLEQLRKSGITAIVSLTEDDLPDHTLRRFDLEYLHLPIPDFYPPSLEQIREFVEFARKHIEQPRGAVAAHCFAGMGRTGTMLSCYLVATGQTASEAIRTVRRLRHGSIETSEQERAVHSYMAWLQEAGQWRSGPHASADSSASTTAASGHEDGPASQSASPDSTLSGPESAQGGPPRRDLDLDIDSDERSRE